MITACDGKNNYVWTGEVNPYNRLDVKWKNKDLDEVQELIDHSTTILMHNAKFDVRALESIGVDCQFWDKIEDTMLASHVVCSGESHALKYLAYKYLDYYNEGEKELAQAVQAARLQYTDYDLARNGHPSFPGLKGEKVQWYKMDYWLCIEECKKYGCDDVEMTWLLWDMFSDVMQQKGTTQQYEVRKRLLSITYEMEREGIHFYKDKVEREIRILKALQESMVNRIHKELNLRFRLNFRKKEDIRTFLFSLLKLEITVRSEKTGAPSMAKDVIEGYIKDNPDVAPLQHYKEYTTAGTQIGYLESYLNWITEDSPLSSSPAPAVHANFLITGTRETRQSVTSPNTQNIDKRLRHIVGPPAGFVWLDYDLVNIEMRIWVYEVGNEELIQVFDGGGSVHLLVASIIHPELYRKCEEEGTLFKNEYKETWYQWVKNGNFAIIYGATEYKADQTYKISGAYGAVAHRFPEVPAYTKRTIAEAEGNFRSVEATPYVTCIGGYRLDVPMSKPFKACNYKIQGSAGYIINLAMNNIIDEPDFHKYDCRIVNQVHDSIVIQVPEGYPEGLPLTFKRSIEEAGLSLLPTCEASYDIIECPKE